MKRNPVTVYLFVLFFSVFCSTALAADPSTLSFEGTKWFTFGSHADCMSAAAKQRKAKEVAARLAEGKTTSIECTQSVKYAPDAAPPPASPPAPVPTSGAPRVFFTDLDSGPVTGGLNDKGVFVTVYGKGFGANRGTVTVGGGAVDNYVSWSDTKVVVQLGAAAKTGNVVVANSVGTSNGVPFTVRSGPVYFVSTSGNGDGSFASPMHPSKLYAAIKPGATFYFRGGTYSGLYGFKTYNDFNIVFGGAKGGTAGNPVAIVGYPGEAVTFSGQTGVLAFRDADSPAPAAGHITVANLRMICKYACVHGSANTGLGVTKSGAAYVRLVGNVMSASYNENTATGIVAIGADGWRVYGNELKDTGAYEPGTKDPIKNNHAIYIQVGASDVDIGWNHLHHLRMGHLIQVHTDIPSRHENVRIHDNIITATGVGESRGINIDRVSPGSYGEIYNNVLSNLGADFSGIAIYSGDWKIHHNTLHNINAYSGMLWLTAQSGKPTATITDNIFVSDGKSPYIGLWDGVTSAHAKVGGNVYFGMGLGPTFDATAVNADPQFVNPATGDFSLKSGSPATGKGALR